MNYLDKLLQVALICTMIVLWGCIGTVAAMMAWLHVGWLLGLSVAFVYVVVSFATLIYLVEEEMS